MYDGTMTKGTLAWLDQIEDTRRWLRGEKPCDCCARPTSGVCIDCKGTRVKPLFTRWVPETHAIEEGIAQLADLVADLDVRGGEDLLTERSKAFVLELRAGLGAALYELIERVRELDADLRKVPDEKWPIGAYDAALATKEAA